MTASAQKRLKELNKSGPYELPKVTGQRSSFARQYSKEKLLETECKLGRTRTKKKKKREKKERKKAARFGGKKGGGRDITDLRSIFSHFDITAEGAPEP